MSTELSSYGCAVIDKLLTPDECREIAALYPHEEHFRSHIHMARHGFGRGEYRYFNYPLPDLLAGLRAAFYPHLATCRQRAGTSAWGSISAIRASMRIS